MKSKFSNQSINPRPSLKVNDFTTNEQASIWKDLSNFVCIKYARFIQLHASYKNRLLNSDYYHYIKIKTKATS